MLSISRSPRMLRRPLMGLALSGIVGTAAGLHGSFPPEPLFLVSVAALLFALLRRHHAASAFALHVGVAALAAAHGQMAAHSPSAREPATLMARPAEYVRVEAVITDEPIVTESYWRDETIRLFSAHLHGMNRAGAWQRARGAVRCAFPVHEGMEMPAYGDRWVFSGLLRQTGLEHRVPDSRHAYRLDVDARQATLRLSAGHGSGIAAACIGGRRFCAGVLALGLDAYPDHTGLLQALLLGYRRELPEQLHDVFARTGTLHIVAISGMHVAVMAGLFLAVFRAAGIPRRLCGLWLAPLLILYTFATGAAASAVRACVMAITFWSAPLVHRRPDGPSALALAAVLILAADPLQLVDPGFVLSFVIVAGLLALVPRFMQPFAALRRGEPWQLAREGFLMRIARGLLFAGAGVAVVSAAAWICSMPLTARYFHLFSPVALLGNLVVVPLSFVVLLTGCLALATGSVWGLLGEIFNHANRVFITLLVQGIRFFESIPGGYRYVEAPPLIVTAAWYVLVAILAAVHWRSRAAIAALTIFLLVGGRWWHSASHRTRLDVLDVTDGAAALLALPGPAHVLFDTGPAFNSRRIEDHLRARGVNRLSALVLSHADARHVGATESLLEKWRVDEIWTTPHEGRSPMYSGALRAAAQKRIPIRRLERGERGVFPGRVTWEILHPPAGRAYRRADDASLVFRLSRYGTSVLMMGGAGSAVEGELLATDGNLAAPILLVGNQAAADTCAPEWLRDVRPELAIVSGGLGNPRGLPSPATLDRLEAQGADVLLTGVDGPVEIDFADRPDIPPILRYRVLSPWP